MRNFEHIDFAYDLDDYASIAGLPPALAELRNEAVQTAKQLAGRRLVMISADDARGSLVENIPSQVALLRACGIDVEWLRFTPQSDQRALHRRLHDLILGDQRSSTVLDESDSQAYAEAGNAQAQKLKNLFKRDDIVLAHGIGSAGLGAALKSKIALRALWRNVGGLDERSPATRAAWAFLKPHLTAYDRGLFTCAQYIPQYFTNRASVLPPSIDPLSARNRPLSLHQTVAILSAAGVLPAHDQVLHAPFSAPVLRLNQKGQWRRPDDMELLYRPVVTQIAQWDYLEGTRSLLQGFAELRQSALSRRVAEMGDHQRRSMERARLLLLLPDKDIDDDDQVRKTAYNELLEVYLDLEPEIAKDICVLSVPGRNDSTERALLVNALQRLSSIYVQNSLAEGFGLGIAEAAYKHIPVLAGATSGARLQIRHKIDGYLCQIPEDPRSVAKSLLRLFSDEDARRQRALSAQRRVMQEFLIIGELQRILRILSELG